MDKTSFFILNVFLNSMLAFLTAVLLIECAVFLFRVPLGRIAATLRMVPIIKLPLDLFLYDFSKWSYAQGINPLNCQDGTRLLSITSMFNGSVLPVNSSIRFSVPGDLTFTLADLIGYSIHPLILNMFALVFIGTTLGFIIRRLMHYFRSLIILDSLAKDSRPLNRKMRNSMLSSYMKKSGLQILTSSTLTGSPFVAGLIPSAIFIPSSLSKNLSRKEYEAVLAHEMEHVRYKDSLVRLILDLIANAFWWIPTKWLHHRIEEGQEIGCDLKCKSYGIDSSVLASAVYKSAKYSTTNSRLIFAPHLTKHAIFNRLNILIQPASNRFRKTRCAFSCLVIGIAFFVILLGRFWVF